MALSEEKTVHDLDLESVGSRHGIAARMGMWATRQGAVAEDGQLLGAMGRQNALHGQVGHVCFYDPARQAGAE
jgi:hypothetical protein